MIAVALQSCSASRLYIKTAGAAAIVSGRPRTRAYFILRPRLLGIGAETRQDHEERHLLDSLTHLVFVWRPPQYCARPARVTIPIIHANSSAGKPAHDQRFRH